MIHIAIDTSALEDNKSLNDANYKALKRLVDAKIISIHIPFIVKREIETQEKELYLEKFKQLKTSLRQFDRVRKNNDLYQKIRQIKTEIDQLEPTILEDADNFSKAWVEGLNSKICELNQNQTTDAWAAYFNGEAPLTSKKERQDIPDSFVCRGIEQIQKDVTDLVVLAKDKKIFDTFKSKPNYEVHKTIREFIASQNIQDKLKDLDKGFQIFQKQTQNLLGFIQSYEQSNPQIKVYLESNIGEAILDSSVNGIPYSNDIDGEATISSYYDGRDVEIDLTNPTHYGEDQIGFKFKLNVEVVVDYFIDKSEYYGHYYGDDDSWISDISVEDWNDHVLHAESTIDVKVTGIVSVKIRPEAANLVELANCDPEKLEDHFHDLYAESEFKIESVDDIEVE